MRIVAKDWKLLGEIAALGLPGSRKRFSRSAIR